MNKVGLFLWMRKIHRYLALISIVPYLLIVVTGILLLLRNDISWISPKAKGNDNGNSTISPLYTRQLLQEILPAIQRVEDAQVSSMKDISQVRIYPRKGQISVRTDSGHEVILDAEHGSVLGHGPLRTGMLIALHEGTWFHPQANYWFVLPASLALLFLWGTGIYLFARFR